MAKPPNPAPPEDPMPPPDPAPQPPGQPVPRLPRDTPDPDEGDEQHHIISI